MVKGPEQRQLDSERSSAPLSEMSAIQEFQNPGIPDSEASSDQACSSSYKHKLHLRGESEHSKGKVLFICLITIKED